jgi:uncharacterized membrane protein
MPEDSADADSKTEQPEPEEADDRLLDSGVIVALTDMNAEEIPDEGSISEFSITTEMVRREAGQVVTSSYEGPLPPPDILRAYDELSPGAAKEIISWVKAESQHRRKLELAESEHRRKLETEESQHRMRLEVRAMDLGERAMNSGIRRATAGMVLAWPLVLGIVAAGTYLITQNHGWEGVALVDSALGLVIGAYILNYLVRPKDKKKPTKGTIKPEGDEE